MLQAGTPCASGPLRTRARAKSAGTQQAHQLGIVTSGGRRPDSIGAERRQLASAHAREANTYALMSRAPAGFAAWQSWPEAALPARAPRGGALARGRALEGACSSASRTASRRARKGSTAAPMWYTVDATRPSCHTRPASCTCSLARCACITAVPCGAQHLCPVVRHNAQHCDPLATQSPPPAPVRVIRARAFGFLGISPCCDRSAFSACGDQQHQCRPWTRHA